MSLSFEKLENECLEYNNALWIYLNNAYSYQRFFICGTKQLLSLLSLICISDINSCKLFFHSLEIKVKRLGAQLVYGGEVNNESPHVLLLLKPLRAFS